MNNKKNNSNRSFGVVFFIVFLIIALYPLLYDHSIRIWSIIVAFTFLFFGLLNSALLTPLNSIWFKFGLLLGKFIAPIVMGIIYFLVVFPTFLLLKLFKRNYLNVKYESDKDTYWKNIKNKKVTMKDQF